MLIIAIAISSCQKQEEILKPKDENQPSITVKDGIIVFSDGESFMELSHKLSNLEDDEFKLWEKKQGFTSMRTEIDSVMDLIDECQDQAIFNDILIENQDIIMLKDSVVDSRIRSCSYLNIINRDGLFYIGEVLHKVNEDIMVASIEGSLSKINAVIKNANEIDINLKSNINEDVFLFILENKEVSLKWGELTSKLGSKTTKGKRRVYLDMIARSVAGLSVKRNNYGLV